jgi:hypothetical protein
VKPANIFQILQCLKQPFVGNAIEEREAQDPKTEIRGLNGLHCRPVRRKFDAVLILRVACPSSPAQQLKLLIIIKMGSAAPARCRGLAGGSVERGVLKVC